MGINLCMITFSLASYVVQELNMTSPLSNPLLFAPPSCNSGMAKKLVEQSGGTYEPAQAGATNDSAQNASTTVTVTDAAGYVKASVASLIILSCVVMSIAT
jgi:hypothetical protein